MVRSACAALCTGLICSLFGFVWTLDVGTSAVNGEERWPQDAEDLSQCLSQQQSLQRKEEEDIPQCLTMYEQCTDASICCISPSIHSCIHACMPASRSQRASKRIHKCMHQGLITWIDENCLKSEVRWIAIFIHFHEFPHGSVIDQSLAMYNPVSACQVAGCLKNLVCVLNICVQYTCIMFEAAWVSVVLLPLLVRKSRWSQEWCAGVYRQNHCRDKTNFQMRHQVRHLETATAGIGCHLIWQSHSLQMKASSLKLGCLPNTWTTWEEKEAQDPPGHLAVDEPYQCGEAHTAPAKVEDSWGLMRTLMYCQFVTVCSAGLFYS